MTDEDVTTEPSPRFRMNDSAICKEVNELKYVPKGLSSLSSPFSSL